ncbi:hypothetical protein ABZ297_39795 [Nonomuraea sp. NPDC005983]|uniref:hypothetical protein n=1 Tax=Nonomuraea sp. NPDC005983 TaxID=3155595 RepID=UPI0033A0960C
MVRSRAAAVLLLLLSTFALLGGHSEAALAVHELPDRVASAADTRPGSGQASIAAAAAEQTSGPHWLAGPVPAERAQVRVGGQGLTGGLAVLDTDDGSCGHPRPATGAHAGPLLTPQPGRAVAPARAPPSTTR